VRRSWQGAGSLSRSTDFGYLPGCSNFVFVVTGSFLAVGLFSFFLWHWTGDDRPVLAFFKLPAPLLLCWLAATELYISLLLLRAFSPEQPMRKAWVLIACSAGCDLVGAISVQVLAVHSPLNPLVIFPWWSESTAASLRAFGLIIGGPCRYALLAAGLGRVLKIYRQSQLRSRLKAIDWALLAILAVYIALQARDVAVALRSGWRPPSAMVLGWPTDPILWFLLAEALLLYRSVQQMGGGYIGRCWRAFSIGVFLVGLGDIGIWITNWSLLPWQWSALGWYIWLPAAGAFALAPAYQLEAIHLALGMRQTGTPRGSGAPPAGIR